MVVKNHNIELQVNKQSVDLFDDIDITFQRLINDPTKIQTTTATYSYSFDLPKSSKNCVIFNYANVPSKLNKFSNVYQAELYVDGISMFKGNLKLSEVNNESFVCNMYENKLNTVDTIFGETTMNEIDWKVDYEGVSTMNSVNSDYSTKYFFPLVSYGLFQKDETKRQSDGTYYTAKDKIDTTTRFYYTSFVPSMNLVETLKKMCQTKGYTLQGDIINDNVLNNIYLSNYIDSEQNPEYNYGTDKMGKCNIGFEGATAIYRTTGTSGTFAYGTPYTLSYPPKEYHVGPSNAGYDNFSTVSYINLLSFLSNEESTTDWGSVSEIENSSNMYSNGWINIPADGYYEIDFLLHGFGVLSRQRAIENVQEYDSNGNIITVTKEKNLENMPVEFHVVRFNGEDGEENTISHELIYTGKYPNESDNLEDNRGYKVYYTNNNNPSTYTERRVAVDVYNNPNFICGIAATQWQISSAYLKNGKSWNNESDNEENVNFYNCQPYYLATESQRGNITYEATEDYNENSLKGVNINEDIIDDVVHYFGNEINNGSAKCIVKLKRNDMIGIYLIRRMYEQKGSFDNTYNVSYGVRFNGRISVRAYSPTDKPTNDFEYGTESKFDKQLNLGNFYNSQQKMKDFFNDVIKAFNLSYQQNGNIITLNTQKQQIIKSAPIDLDNRVNESDFQMSAIDFPKSLEVKFSVDTEEEGFYNSVPEDKLNDSDWKDFGDSGSTKITLSNNDEGNELSQSLNFSYNWFKEFTVFDFKSYVNSGSTFNYLRQIPVIAKSEWFIPSLKYEEYAKEDGRSFKQRFWFRNTKADANNLQLPVNTTYDKAKDNQWYNVVIPLEYMSEGKTRYYLNYKKPITQNVNINNETLLTRYFNLSIDTSSNILELDCYLSPNEYQILQKGGCCKVDSDLYLVLEIQFDVSGDNLSKLKLMKL